ncbi:MAG TPA: AtpZ/AtpI family protein [Steroidobacteraceae bacterium]|nr:AtpZ/AtpI family protein [Steroidobacteraceae bacterium]
MKRLEKATAGMEEAVKARRERDARWKRDGERTIGQNLAMIGSLGWTVVVPSLLGVLAGRWLDRRLHMGIFWTLGLLVLGLALGCVMAWKRMQRA